MGQVLRAWESSRSDPRGAKPGCGGEITKRAALAKKEKIELKIKVSWYIKVCCKEEKNNHCFFCLLQLERTRSNGLKLQQERNRVDTKKSCIMMRRLKYFLGRF